MKTIKNGHKKGATSAGPEITQNINSIKNNITNYNISICGNQVDYIKEVYPCCPNCSSTETVGKVNSYNAKTGCGMTAYFCSHCLTEYDKNRSILTPLWRYSIEVIR